MIARFGLAMLACIAPASWTAELPVEPRRPLAFEVRLIGRPEGMAVPREFRDRVARLIEANGRTPVALRSYAVMPFFGPMQIKLDDTPLSPMQDVLMLWFQVVVEPKDPWMYYPKFPPPDAPLKASLWPFGVQLQPFEGGVAKPYRAPDHVVDVNQTFDCGIDRESCLLQALGRALPELMDALPKAIGWLDTLRELERLHAKQKNPARLDAGDVEAAKRGLERLGQLTEYLRTY